jgi:hypothetical protein
VLSYSECKRGGDRYLRNVDTYLANYTAVEGQNLDSAMRGLALAVVCWRSVSTSQYAVAGGVAHHNIKPLEYVLIPLISLRPISLFFPMFVRSTKGTFECEFAVQILCEFSVSPQFSIHPS